MLVNPAGVLVERCIRDREQERRHSRVAHPHREDPRYKHEAGEMQRCGQKVTEFY